MRANRFNHSVREGCLPQSNSATLWFDASSSTTDRGGLGLTSLKYGLLRKQFSQRRDDPGWTVECLRETGKLRRRQLKVFLVSQGHFSRLACTFHDESSHLLASLLRPQADQALLAIGGAKVDALAPGCRFLFECGCHVCPSSRLVRTMCVQLQKDANASGDGCQKWARSWLMRKSSSAAMRCSADGWLRWQSGCSQVSAP